MSELPPSYAPTDEKAGLLPENPGYPPPQQAGPPPENPGYPPQQAGYSPQQAGPYLPQQAGYPPQQPGYPPPQSGYPPRQPVQTQPQVITTTIVTSFGKYPVRIICPNCRTEQIDSAAPGKTLYKMTVTRRMVGAMNWIVCGVIALILLILGFELLIPFFLIPFAFIALCIPGLMDVEHVCPNCNHVNGSHRSM